MNMEKDIENFPSLDEFIEYCWSKYRKDRNLYRMVQQMIEKSLLEKVLEETEGNQVKASRILGFNRNTLYAKIKQRGIDVRKYKVF